MRITTGDRRSPKLEKSIKMIARQGDVLLIPVDSVPEDAREKPLFKGHVVLAYGESTGHYHRFEDTTSRVMVSERGEYLVVDDVEREITPKSIIEITKDATGEKLRVLYDAGRVICLNASMFDEVERIINSLGTLKVRGSLLVHDEHDTIVYPPGKYQLPGQREFVSSDMSPVRVID